MKPRRSNAHGLKPIWRSRGFWMGCLVVLFLCWAWGNSLGHRSWVSWHSYQITSARGILDISVNKHRHFGRKFSMGSTLLDRSTDDIPILEDIPMIRDLFLPRPKRGRIYFSREEFPNGWTQIGAQWWILTLTWLLLWLPTLRLYRRWQRNKQIAALPTSFPGAKDAPSSPR